MEFKKINPTELDENLIKLLSEKWTLITTKNNEKVNMMTASWGGFGEMWGKHVAYSVIRPSRYTFSNMENNEKYTLCFLDEKYKDVLSYCGKVSGKNSDKVKETKLTVEEYDGFYYFKESKYVFCCEKLYADMMKKEAFESMEFADKMYPDTDIHKLYFGEIRYLLLK